MKYPVIEINCAEITDWDSFHDVFASSFDFSDYYGRNMDAWNDCMSDLDSPVGMATSFWSHRSITGKETQITPMTADSANSALGFRFREAKVLQLETQIAQTFADSVPR